MGVLGKVEYNPLLWVLLFCFSYILIIHFNNSSYLFFRSKFFMYGIINHKLFKIKKIAMVSVIFFLSCAQPNKSEKSSDECNQDPEYFLLRPEVEKGFGYSHAVKICNQIKISGAVSMDEYANPTAAGDMEQQTKNCYAASLF